MGLQVGSISTWPEMETVFLDKYQDYYKVRDGKEELFRMKQLEDESLEDYVDRFMFVYKRCAKGLNDDISQTIFLQGVDDESKEALNLMGKGDINKIPLEEIVNICRSYSRTRVGTRGSKRNKALGPDVSQVMEELENLKTNILLHLNTQVENKNTEPSPI